MSLTASITVEYQENKYIFFFLNDLFQLSLFLSLQRFMEDLEPEEQFLQYARNGDLLGIQRLLMSKIKEEMQININCKGT